MFILKYYLMETNLHSLPDVLKIVLQDLLLLCHNCPTGVGCLAILQENKNILKYKYNTLSLFLNEMCARCDLKRLLHCCCTAKNN